MSNKKELELVNYNKNNINNDNKKNNELVTNKNNIKNNILNNDFYQSLKNTMKHEEVKDFFVKYFNDELNTKTSIMYISLYLMIEDKIKKYSNADNVSSDLILEMIHEIITSENRSTIVNQFQESWSSQKCIKSFENNKKKVKNEYNSMQNMEDKMEKNNS